MADRDSGAKRGLFRRGARGETDAPAPESPVTPVPRRERRASGEMFQKPAGGFEDPWSSDAWAEDGWNDEWADPKSRASIRPAAAPRSADVDAWLESDQTEFADATADMARKWVPDGGKTGAGATWDEPENPASPRPDIDDRAQDFSTPKVETLKVETPEAAKVDVPEAPVFEAPKLEAAKLEAAKLEAPKVELPKSDALPTGIVMKSAADAFVPAPEAKLSAFETPAVELAKTDLKLETPKPDAAKFDAAKPDVAKFDATRAEAPKLETPQVDAAKPDAAKTDGAKFETSRTTIPVETPTVVGTPPPPVEPLSWMDAPKVVARPAPLPKVTPTSTTTPATPATTPTSTSPAAATSSTVPVLPVGSTWDAEPVKPVQAFQTDLSTDTDIDESLRAELEGKPKTSLAAAVTKTTPATPATPASDIMGAGWDDEPEPQTWKDDPVVRSLDDDFVEDVATSVVVDRSVPVDAERRSVPRSVQASLVPDEYDAYDDVDRSIDLDLAEELDHELPTFVRHERKAAAGTPTKPKARKADPVATPKRAAIGTSMPTPPLAFPKAETPLPKAKPAELVPAASKPTAATTLIDDDVWDDVDPNSLAASRLDEQLEDRPKGTNKPIPAAKPAPQRTPLKPKPVTPELVAPERKWSSAPTNATDLSIVRLLMMSGLGLAGLAVVRLVLALVSTIKGSTETNGFGVRLVDASINLGTEQAVLLVLAVTFAILGRFVAHGRIESVNRLTGRACGVILGAASATLLLAAARLINDLGADRADFASQSQAALEFLAVGGISLVAIAAAWSTSAE
jgi:hypothetical protein